MFQKKPSVRGTADDHISKELEDADDGENNEHRQPNHVAVAHLIAVADGKVADAARADRAAMAVMPTKLTKVIIVTRVMPGILPAE